MMEFIEFLNRRWRFIWPFKGTVCWEMQIGFIVIQYAFDDWWHDRRLKVWQDKVRN